MSALGEVVRQVGLLLVGWTAISVVAVWPVVWWMRRRAALNESDLALLAGAPADRASAPPAATSATAR